MHGTADIKDLLPLSPGDKGASHDYRCDWP